MINEKTFVANSFQHVHIWVRNDGENLNSTKWTLAITKNANDPFNQPLANSWNTQGVLDSKKAESIKRWLEQSRCGNMYDNLAGKLLRIQADLKAAKQADNK